MTLRKLLREANLPSKALFFFPEQDMTGVGLTKMLVHKEEAVVGGMVTVNWEGQIVQAKLIALSGKCPLHLQLSVRIHVRVSRLALLYQIIYLQFTYCLIVCFPL